MSHFVHISSIASMYDFLGSEKPDHPLIAIVREWPKTSHNLSQITFTSDLYFITRKSNKEGALPYGRTSYDYQQGTMLFVGPGQAVTFSGQQEPSDDLGWSILFHPDLIHNSALDQDIRNYSFFNYEVNEALHLAEKERAFLDSVVTKIEQEILQHIDRHSAGIVVHHLETILKYSLRYYERQFYTRSSISKGHVSRFETYLKGYYSSVDLAQKGLLSVEQCGKALNMSPSYLSDLLRATTGRSAKDHIHSHLIELAKSRLLGSQLSVSEIAYNLGFGYPQHFSKLFKAKTGLSPTDFRRLN